MDLPYREVHVGRSWGGPGPKEADCPCPKAPCGLVDMSKAVDGCPEHSIWSGKTLRTLHDVSRCPALECEK